MIDEKTLEQLFEAGQICIVTSPAGKTWLCFRVADEDGVAEMGTALTQAYIEEKKRYGTEPIVLGY